MEHLWTPWRYAYVSTADHARRQGVPPELSAWPGEHNCVFCNMLAAVDFAVAQGMSPEDAERAVRIIHRGAGIFVVLNTYPYCSGHLMVVPYEHQGSLAALAVEVAREIIETAQRTERALRLVYSPQGLNFGLNLGEAAGAGVAGHLHLHGLPRWTGDTNFMTVIGETRILPEELDVTWQRLRQAFQEVAHQIG
jgi:ATP adenylyltransferase